ncbi:Glycosyl transferase family 2 [Quadrisphaera granulorum]|uniref:Glycosyl transferase family 2 n=1 Tax=Quadrisphaera granulorum TaxID=317664 RepID=A0A316AFH6_9ACTN|nr:glycosyltransferase family 2 protein [Quadrisphaera granulorum]PWJ55730.1 glycosyl transferase family 2 [Quadrisphaera granulorum]SZE95227.1 Glycosyl transferase family 2 [Quadrisphaera granulorum]
MSAGAPTTLSIVIPALNESENMPALMAGLPLGELGALGWDVEVIVVDNASEDGTGDLARALGATVVEQPRRGYGNAYAAGFDAARGDIIATGDADLTYPFDHLPDLLRELVDGGVDFLTTDRLHRANAAAMKTSHAIGNAVLSTVSRALFGSAFRDSQSGMWIFRRSVWSSLDVRSPGMAFSQEIKNEAWRRGFTCREVPIEYRPRGGVVKLNATRDGLTNLAQLFAHRLRRPVDLASTSQDVVSTAIPAPASPLASQGPSIGGGAPRRVIDLREPQDATLASDGVS